MSGSISESEACGNDWDETWKPPSTPGACATPKSSTFSWNPPWKKVETVLVNPDGHRKVVSDDASCFQPIKLQFLMINCTDRLKTLIYKIPTLDVKCLMTGTELLEITLKSDVHPGVTTEVAAVLSNEIEDVFLKMIPRLPFTCNIAEDLFITYIQDGKMTMVRDDSKVYIVGPSTSKNLICSTIDQFKGMITTETVSFDKKWKRVVLSKMKAISSLSDKFKDVSIRANDDARNVLFQGRKADVKEAVRELDTLMSNLYVNKISVEPLVLQLLLCEKASSLFSSILDRHQFDVLWTVDENHLFVVGNNRVSTGNIKQLVSENFVNVGFSSLSSTSDPFTKSKMFIDTIRANENTLLVVELGESGCNVASTKTISRILLQQEHAWYEMAAKSVQVNDTDKEVTEHTRIISKLTRNLQSQKEDNIKAHKEAEKLNMRLRSLAQENQDANSKIEQLTLEHRDLQKKLALLSKERRNNMSVNDSFNRKGTRKAGEDTEELKKMFDESHKVNKQLKCTVGMEPDQNVQNQGSKKEKGFPQSVIRKKEVDNVERLISLEITGTEYELLKHFRPKSRAFIGNTIFRKDLLWMSLQKSEKENEVKTQCQTDIAHIRSLNRTEIVCYFVISEQQYLDIKHSAPGNVFYDLSRDRKMLTMFNEKYTLLQEARHKAEIILGLKREGTGRLHRVIASETYALSSRKNPIHVSQSENTALRRCSNPDLTYLDKELDGLAVKCATKDDTKPGTPIH